MSLTTSVTESQISTDAVKVHLYRQLGCLCHHRSWPLGVCLGVPERFHWGRKTLHRCGQHYPMEESPGMAEREKTQQKQIASTVPSGCRCDVTSCLWHLPPWLPYHARLHHQSRSQRNFPLAASFRYYRNKRTKKHPYIPKGSTAGYGN